MEEICQFPNSSAKKMRRLAKNNDISGRVKNETQK